MLLQTIVTVVTDKKYIYIGVLIYCIICIILLNQEFLYLFQSIRNNLKKIDRIMKMGFSQQGINGNLEASLS